MQWNIGSTKYSKQMFGLLNWVDSHTPKVFRQTSSATTLSTLWQAVTGSLEVTVVTALDRNAVYFTTYVKLRNIGASTLSNLYCKFIPIFYFLLFLSIIIFKLFYIYIFVSFR